MNSSNVQYNIVMFLLLHVRLLVFIYEYCDPVIAKEMSYFWGKGKKYRRQLVGESAYCTQILSEDSFEYLGNGLIKRKQK